MDHYNRTPRRKAEFIKPPNTLKAKVGTGGLTEEILNKAQKLLEENTLDFSPLAYVYLENLWQGIEAAKHMKFSDDTEVLITGMLYPAMQLKANGGMFRFHIVTQAADRLVQFLEVLEEIDTEALEIIMAFYGAIKAVIQGKITGDGGENGKELVSALSVACVKYFERRPPRIEFQ